ncbi:Kelch repeat-containing protein [Ancylomarina longa]|uniref:Galactose oxidase n=1 Tax=Ancylomarina longa TaxID=2487017 RepID=A0A434AVX8_9BACT|nr:kelch repeat-containing protein [Ancylomarina longa]RUT78658.1 galactose oxidase [Ancylomarina longa]
MRQRFLLGIIAIFSILTSCSSGSSLDGNWIKRSSYAGRVRSNAVCFVIGDYAYVGTGYDGDDRLVDFRKYNAELDRWSDSNGADAVPAFPGLARQSAVGFAAGGKGFVGTGFDGDITRLSDFWEFDPDSKTWTQIADLPGGARQEAVAFGIGNFGYVGTGYGFLDGDDKNELKDFWKLDATTGVWSSIGFSGEKVRGASAFVIDNKAYVCLGRSNGIAVNDNWEFNPDSDTWTKKTDLDDDNIDKDGNILRYNAATFVIGGKGYVASGSNGFLKRDVWEYDPSKDDWVERTSLEAEVASREYAVGFSLNNRGFIATGSSSGLRLDDVWEFNPTMEEVDTDN